MSMQQPTMWQPVVRQEAGIQGALLTEYNKIINNLNLIFSRYFSGLTPVDFGPRDIAIGSPTNVLNKLSLNRGELIVGTATGVGKLGAGMRDQVVTVDPNGDLTYTDGVTVNRWRIVVGI